MAIRKLARGTQLQRGAGDPLVFVKIAQAINYDGPSMTAGVFSFDDHDVPAGYKTKLKSGKDGGQMTVNIHLDLADASHGNLFADFEDLDNTYAYRFVHPSATKRLAFNALVVGITPGAPVDGAITANVTFDVDGPVTVEDNV